MKKNKSKNIKKSFGDRIKYYRALKGLTQSELAKKIGKTEETVSNIERGLNSTKLEVIQDIARALSIDIMQLFDFVKDGEIKDKEKFALIKEVVAILNEKDRKFISGLLQVLRKNKN